MSTYPVTVFSANPPPLALPLHDKTTKIKQVMPSFNFYQTPIQTAIQNLISSSTSTRGITNFRSTQIPFQAYLAPENKVINSSGSSIHLGDVIDITEGKITLRNSTLQSYLDPNNKIVTNSGYSIRLGDLLEVSGENITLRPQSISPSISELVTPTANAFTLPDWHSNTRVSSPVTGQKLDVTLINNLIIFLKTLL